ncbi:unnamed protein product [Orchesella dallaii]|uniref:Uncharacterized protein n=1 Tax=Orchesella dallaii TaxID=48710 RepID=A0ABP1QPI5_9HEXA
MDNTNKKVKKKGTNSSPNRNQNHSSSEIKENDEVPAAEETTKSSRSKRSFGSQLMKMKWKLFKILVFIVLINVFLIWAAWRVYGESITDKFLRPSSSVLLIEELKQSIAELKLPKEHSPRI